MNITTNYSHLIQNQQLSNKNQVRQAHVQNAVHTDMQYAGNVNFTGMEKILKPLQKLVRSKAKNDAYEDFLHYGASVLNKNTDDIEKIIIGKSKRRQDFFGTLLEKYNRDNFYAKNDVRENTNIVTEIFENVKSPSDVHFAFVAGTDIPLTQTKGIFEKFDNNKKKLDQVFYIYKDLDNVKLEKNQITGYRARRNEIINDMINSPNADEYLSNYKKYKPFIYRNAGNKNVIAELDKTVAENSYDEVLTAKQHKLEETFSGSQITGNQIFNPSKLAEHYSEEGNQLMELVQQKLILKGNLSDKDSRALTEIYKSTNKKNVEARFDFLGYNYANGLNREKYNEDELQNINTLFNKMDEDRHVKKFITKMSHTGRSLGDAGTYLKLIDEVNPALLAHDTKNIVKVMNSSFSHKTEAVFDFYKTEPQSRMGRAIKTVKSLFAKKPVDTDEYENYPRLSLEDARLFAPTRTFAKQSDCVTENTAAAAPAAKAAKTVKHRTFFKPVVQKQPSAKKMVVINDVNNLIEKKLGKNVYADQSRSYADKATKMRLNMLPEIFDSIKDTRAAARKDGTFNKRTTVKNEDAYGLYRRINGKNKRLVNYMLKVRNEDGTRKFNINDIVTTLDNTRKQAVQLKAAAPKENPFRANDEKMMYTSLLNEKMSVFGKLRHSNSDNK